MIDFGLTFLTGLLTSLHCVGMCGMIVLAYSTQPAESGIQARRFSDVLLHSFYNIGRIAAYIALGLLIGWLGMTVRWFKDAGDYLSLASGAIMIISGIAMLGFIRLSPFVSLFGASSAFTKIQAKLLRKKTAGSKLLLGLLTPLLPCGVLYAMIAKAAAEGTVLNSALTMGTFGLGMAPALILLGSLSSFFTARIRKHGERVAAIIIILMGIILILRGFHVPYLSWMSSEPKCPKCAS